MRPRALKRRIAAACAGIILAGTGVGWAAKADADIIDDAFIATLDAEGITYPSPAYAIRAAYMACDYMDAGMSPYVVAAELAKVSYLSINQASFFTGAAIGAYCPWNASLVYGGGAAV